MSTNSTNSRSAINHYIAGFPAEVQPLLEAVRKTIAAAAPDATETIGYGIPTFKLEGNLVHFAAFKRHIGFYPGDSGIRQFEEALKNYKTSKGTVQFPLNEPIPLDLIARITSFRVAENGAKAKQKTVKKTKK